MTPLIQALLSVGTTVLNERIKTKSTIDGAVFTSGALLAGSGNFPGVPDGSIESYALMVVMGLIGMYRVFVSK